MNKMPINEINLLFPREIAALWNYSETERMPAIDYAHRHDYYIFLFMEKGHAKLLVDFMEYEHTGQLCSAFYRDRTPAPKVAGGRSYTNKNWNIKTPCSHKCRGLLLKIENMVSHYLQFTDVK
jgi:hypothetical protein